LCGQNRMNKTYRLLSNQIHSVAHKGFFHLLSANFFIQFLGFGTSLLVAKFLTPVELGEVRIIQSYFVVFSVMAVFGHSSAVLKFCSEEQSQAKRESILKAAVIRVFLFTSITFGLLGVLVYSGLLTSSRELAIWLLIYALILPFSALTEVFIAYLQALKKIKEMAQAQSIIKIQSFLLIIIATAFSGFKGFIFSTIFAYLLGLIPLLIQVDRKFFRAARNSLPSSFTSVAIFSFLANGVNVVGQFGDIFILDHFMPDREAIGYYAFAVIFILAARQITATVQSISTPYFSERAQDKSWVRSRFIETQLKTSAMSIIVALGVYALAWVLLRLFYEPEYSAALVYLGILLLRYLLWSSVAIGGVVLFALNYVHINFVVSLLSTVIGLAGAYFLLQRIGLPGVAWAQVFASGVMFILTYIVLWKVLRK
jgi:O-antigen/teichoic acid export membrane protein